MALLIILAGPLFPQHKDTVPSEFEKAQVVEGNTDDIKKQSFVYPSGKSHDYSTNTHKELNQDSLISYAISLLAGLSTTPTNITNNNKNTIHFIYEDSILAEEVVKILNETLPQVIEQRKAAIDSLSHEIGMRMNYIAEALMRTKQREAKAHLVVWPILSRSISSFTYTGHD